MSIGSPTILRELGSYELLEKIAEGGMGAVFKARRKTGGPVVAIKVLPPETARNRTLMKRFEQEFRAATLIDHPNVVRAIEYCGGAPTPFLVMEYVAGCSLGTKIERDGPLSEADAIHVISQVCEGLHGAHKQGLIHRDVKPDNVLLTDDLIAKLTDLGLVRDVESDDNLTRTGRGLGTPYFMAPEQFRNAKHVDVRSDVYSLGATLYMSITGRPPFEKCSPLDCWVKKTRDDFPAPKELVPGISDRLDFAIRRAMRADPANRPRSCREFMEDVLGEAWKPNYLGPASGRYTAPPDANLWYLVYYENGHARTVKGQTATVRKNLQSGNFGELATVLVSRSKSGPFAPLKNTPEFRDLVCGGQTTPNSSPSRQRLTPTSQNSSANPGTRLAPTLPTNTPSPPRPATSDSTALGTDELPSVPVTNRATIDLDTSERPHLSTRKKHPLLPSSDTSSQGVRLPWWAMATLLFATLILGLLGGRFLF